MATYADLVIADGAVAYWPLSETSGTTVASLVGSFPGTITGGVTLGVAGPITGIPAMRFNGTSGKIIVANGSYAAFGTGGLTVECWTRLLATPTNAALMDLKGNGTAQPGPYLTVDATQLYCRVYNTASAFAVAQTGAVAAMVADGRWHHVVGVLSRGPDELRLYLDAVGGTGVTFPAGTSASSSSALGLATASQGSIWFLNGELAHAAVYQTALTSTQIAAHFAAASAAPPRLALIL